MITSKYVTVLESGVLVTLIDIVERLKGSGFTITKYSSYAHQIMEVGPLEFEPGVHNHNTKRTKWRSIIRENLGPLGANIPTCNSFVVPCEGGFLYFRYDVGDDFLLLEFCSKGEFCESTETRTPEVQDEAGQVDAGS